jgi:hypothetical protein
MNGVLLAGVLCVSACMAAPPSPPRPGSAAAQSIPPPDRVEVIPPAPSHGADPNRVSPPALIPARLA